jgi:hypothetical protein
MEQNATSNQQTTFITIILNYTNYLLYKLYFLHNINTKNIIFITKIKIFIIYI